MLLLAEGELEFDEGLEETAEGDDADWEVPQGDATQPEVHQRRPDVR